MNKSNWQERRTMCKLVFDQEKYTVETVTMEGQTLTYRAYEDIPYVTNPVDDKMERLSIFVPEVFYEGKSVNGYNLENAPIFLPNTTLLHRPTSFWRVIRLRKRSLKLTE